jgi:uncharacterized protein (DUF342 family)
MGESNIFQNEFLRIFIGSGGIYVETFKKGFPIDNFSSILLQHPEIGVTSLRALRNAVNAAPQPPVLFGELKERISLEISPGNSSATATFNLPKEELDISNRQNLLKELHTLFEQKGIVYGIKTDPLIGELKSGIPYIVAEGIPPVDGADAVIRMYELQDARPEVREDGRVDYYELKLINRVSVGDWLGERIEATEGIPGKSIKGEPIMPNKGKTLPLSYDKNSVQEIYNNGRTTLYSRFNGAVSYTNGKISVSNHLEISGDVGLSTGNIKFDGYLTVKGSVSDGFSVEATKDVEINSPLGLGSVRSIISTGGSIYIKGGISPKGKAEIRAAKNVFIKFVDNANITCGGIAHIGYYSLNSNIDAMEVVLDASNGQIIGGYIRAGIRVSAPIIGSEIERKTIVEVSGFNRQTMLETLENLLRKISGLKTEQQRLKQLISSVDTSQMNQFQKKEYNDAGERIYFIREEIKNLEDERKNIAEYLKAHGEGEIAATKRIYPNSTLIIKGEINEITSATPAAIYYFQDGEVKKL